MKREPKKILNGSNKMKKRQKVRHKGMTNQTLKDINRAFKALEERDELLDKIKVEIEEIEINGHIRDVECFSAGINAALNVINKYKAESEDKEHKW